MSVYYLRTGESSLGEKDRRRRPGETPGKRRVAIGDPVNAEDEENRGTLVPTKALSLALTGQGSL